jgi:hypothetical protein
MGTMITKCAVCNQELLTIDAKKEVLEAAEKLIDAAEPWEDNIEAIVQCGSDLRYAVKKLRNLREEIARAIAAEEGDDAVQ